MISYRFRLKINDTEIKKTKETFDLTADQAHLEACVYILSIIRNRIIILNRSLDSFEVWKTGDRQKRKVFGLSIELNI